MSTSGPEVPGGLTVRMTRDTVGVITSVDESIVEMLGWRPEQLVGSPSTTFLHPEDQASGLATWLDMIYSTGSSRVWRGRYQTADGLWKWVQTVNCLEDSDHPVVVSLMTPVTVEQAGVEEELRA